MKAMLLLLLLPTSWIEASTTSFLLVKMPVCLLSETAEYPPIVIMDVPMVVAHGADEMHFGLICREYNPPSTVYWVKPYNVNSASIYGISISVEMSPNNQTLRITIDASSAKQPKDWPYSVEEVGDAVEKCVTLMEPEILPNYKKIIVRKPAKSAKAPKKSPAR